MRQAPRGLIARFDVAIASIATLALGVCVNAQSPAAVSFRTLARGADSKIQTRHELVARTVGSWHLLWHEHGGADDPPPIDVTREVVVAVFAGKRPSADQSIEIVTVTRDGETLVVHYRDQVAATNTVAAKAATPFHIVAVRANAPSFRFVNDR